MKNFEILMVFIVTVLSIFTANKWDELELLGKVLMVLSILAAFIVLINSFRKSREEKLIKRIESKFGEIDTKGATKRILMLGNRDDGTVINLVGGSFTVPNVDYNPLIKLEIVKGKLLIDVIIRGLNGEVVAAIEGSTWTVFDSNYEYNNKENIFELVTKGERHVYFQTFYTRGLIYLSGYLMGKNGAGIVIYNIDRKPSTSIIYATDGKDQKMISPSEIQIPRIFKYPRGKYLGQFDKNSSYFS